MTFSASPVHLKLLRRCLLTLCLSEQLTYTNLRNEVSLLLSDCGRGRVTRASAKVMNAPKVAPSTKALVYLSGRLIYLETNTDLCLCVDAFVKSALAVALGDS